jgi:hypothetical protein
MVCFIALDSSERVIGSKESPGLQQSGKKSCRPLFRKVINVKNCDLFKEVPGLAFFHALRNRSIALSSSNV